MTNWNFREKSAKRFYGREKLDSLGCQLIESAGEVPITRVLNSCTCYRVGCCQMRSTRRCLGTSAEDNMPADVFRGLLYVP